jgi:hypothetical protein
MRKLALRSPIGKEARTAAPNFIEVLDKCYFHFTVILQIDKDVVVRFSVVDGPCPTSRRVFGLGARAISNKSETLLAWPPLQKFLENTLPRLVSNDLLGCPYNRFSGSLELPLTI